MSNYGHVLKNSAHISINTSDINQFLRTANSSMLFPSNGVFQPPTLQGNNYSGSSRLPTPPEYYHVQGNSVHPSYDHSTQLSQNYGGRTQKIELSSSTLVTNTDHYIPNTNNSQLTSMPSTNIGNIQVQSLLPNHAFYPSSASNKETCNSGNMKQVPFCPPPPLPFIHHPSSVPRSTVIITPQPLPQISTPYNVIPHLIKPANNSNAVVLSQNYINNNIVNYTNRQVELPPHEQQNLINNMNVQNTMATSNISYPRISLGSTEVSSSSNNFQSSAVVEFPVPLSNTSYAVPLPSVLYAPLTVQLLPETTVSNNPKNIVQQFLAKCNIQEKMVCVTKQKPVIALSKFQDSVKDGLSLLKELSSRKNDLQHMLRSDATSWNVKVAHILTLQKKLSDICESALNPEVTLSILVKLKKMKRKRKYHKKRKEYQNFMKKEKEQQASELHRDIDRYLDTLRQKYLKQKREAEMKKEADVILAEVRRKIYEAKKMIEKLNILEKLRTVRRENAVKKGMFILPKYDRNFASKVSKLKEIMTKQLQDYDAEEKALKVMLETEQEGQLEEEEQWGIRKLKEIYGKKFSNIMKCLFGENDEPLPNDQLYYFWQYYNSGNMNLDSLVKIRQGWDMFLVPTHDQNSSSIPSEWIVPDPPSSDIWSSCLHNNIYRSCQI